MKTNLKSMFAAALVGLASVGGPVAARAEGPRAGEPFEQMPVPYRANTGFVIEADAAGNRACRRATFEESQEIRRKSPDAELTLLQPEKAARAAARKAAGTPATGLTIILHATSQLHSFPQAEAAYVRAAETWEALIKTPITVDIDVDFGPKRFGVAYPANVIGSTDSQFGNVAYRWSGVRSALIAKASSQAEADLYAKLPAASGVPTSVGTSTLVYIPSSIQRALGILPASEDLDTAQQASNLGDRPSIGFNSAFNYDFDPTNGVGSNQQDFNATALHELGHALGLDSWAGITELDSSAPNLVTTWDLFRFRPGVTIDGFDSTQRVLSSGGEQVQFSGGGTTRLSTGRPDASGGDHNQASHWKDNVLNNNTYLGIMDPTGADGDKDQLTAVDMATLDLIGYDVRGLVSFEDAAGALDGNTLTITGLGTVANLVLTSATVKLLDGSGATLATLPATSLNMAGHSAVQVTLTVPGLEDYLSATGAQITLTDDKGNTSAPLLVDFGAAETGGPSIATLAYTGKKMKVVGTGFSSSVQLEVNGVVRTTAVKVKGSTKLQIKGTPADLGLVSGANRVRFVSGGAHSNIFVLNN